MLDAGEWGGGGGGRAVPVYRGGPANKYDLKAEVIRAKMACDSQVTLTMLPETWVHL